MTTLRVLTIVLSLLIIIGAGHGIGPLVLFEVFSLNELISGDFQINITGRYDERLTTVGLIAFIGQSVLAIALFFDKRIKSILTIIGSLILVAAIAILTQGSEFMNLDMISLIFSLPSIVTALILVTVETKGLIRNTA